MGRTQADDPDVNLAAFEKLERGDQDQTKSPGEIGLVLYSLVRLSRPRIVSEFGCYKGTTTAWLVRAVLENESGRVYAYDSSLEHIKESALTLMDCIGQNAPVSLVCDDLNSGSSVIQTEFGFIDHEPKEKYGYLLDRLEVPTDGLLCFHDLTFQPAAIAVGTLYESMERSNQWDLLRLPWARGLIVARKR